MYLKETLLNEVLTSDEEVQLHITLRLSLYRDRAGQCRGPPRPIHR
jgi:hypothetical protein